MVNFGREPTRGSDPARRRGRSYRLTDKGRHAYYLWLCNPENDFKRRGPEEIFITKPGLRAGFPWWALVASGWALAFLLGLLLG